MQYDLRKTACMCCTQCSSTAHLSSVGSFLPSPRLCLVLCVAEPSHPVYDQILSDQIRVQKTALELYILTYVSHSSQIPHRRKKRHRSAQRLPRARDEARGRAKKHRSRRTDLNFREEHVLWALGYEPCWTRSNGVPDGAIFLS